MQITPLFDRLLLEELQTNKSTGGIILPEGSQEKPQLATVVKVGNGIEENGNKVVMIVKPGQTVAYSKYAGSSIVLQNKTYILLKQCDVLAIIEN